MIIGVAILYGIAIELLQAPLPDRYFSYADVVAYAIGALLELGYLAVESRIPYVQLDRRE